MNIDKYINSSISKSENHIYELINIKSQIQNEDISYPYCYFYHIGMFMNIILGNYILHFIFHSKSNKKKE